MAEITPATAYSSGTSHLRPAGGHRGGRGRKISDYGKQLAEKQKARREYGLRETQFRRYFGQAAKSTIATGQALLTALELRLDTIVYRGGIAKTRAMARQFVNHRHVCVNGHIINAPGYTVKVGDMVGLKNHMLFEYNKEVIIPNWLSYSPKSHTVTVERMPKAEDLVSDINSQLIIEFYSR